MRNNAGGPDSPDNVYFREDAAKYPKAAETSGESVRKGSETSRICETDGTATN